MSEETSSGDEPATPHGIPETLLPLFQSCDDLPSLKRQVAALRGVVLSLIQDVAVLKEAIVASGVATTAGLGDRLQNQMLSDHVAAGPAPWLTHSYYPYTLSEPDRLRRAIPGITDEQIASFLDAAREAETLT